MSPEQLQLLALAGELEAQRQLLGDAVVESALAALNLKLAALAAAPAAARAEAPSADSRPDTQTLKQVTILFLDIVDSTRLSQRLDPEETHAVMDGMLAGATGIVESQGGKVLQYAGDSVLSVFGADETREDDPERAIRAGLAMLAEAQRQAVAVQREYGHEGFDVRIGIHTGPVLLGGGVGAEGSIRGTAVNVAARMEQTAPAGALRISRATYRHVRGLFDVQPQPPLTVKGLAEPVVTYLVLRAKPRAFRDTRHGIEGIETPMVGRDAELGRLTSAFELAIGTRHLCVLTVVADAGLGKSRLVAEFEQWVELRPESVWMFRGRAQPRSLNQPYSVLHDLLCWRFEIQDSDSLEQAKAKLAQGLAPVFGARAEEQTALLGQLIGLDYRASPHVAGILGDGKQLRGRAFHAASEYFRGLTTGDGGPLLMLLDDLQWADEGSLDFIEHFARSAADLPVFVLCAARPALYERRPAWGGEPGQGQRIALAALGAASRHALANALLERIDDPPAVLCELLTSGADGNPFYMEELTLMLIDDGVIVPGPLRWQVVPDKLLNTRVPTTLTGVLQARIDALPPAEKRALQQASVIGPLFWDDALAQLNPAAPQALPALDRRQLVFGHATSAFESTGEFAFSHHLLHQVTYDGVLKRYKREQHRITALWLEQRSAGRSVEYLGLLAEHFERGGEVERAVRYWTQAAEEAARRSADDAALAHTDRALALHTDPDAATRFALFNVREGVFARRFAREARAAAITELERLAELSGDGLQRLQAAQRRAWLLFTGGSLELALTTARRALAWAGPVPTGDAARVHNVMVGSLARLGRFDEAGVQGRAGLAMARAAGDKTVQGHLLNNLANVSMDSGDLSAAAARYQEAISTFRDIGDRWGIAGALGNQAALWLLLGRPAQARQQLEENLRLCLEAGNRGAEASARLGLGQALRALGEPRAALDAARAAHALASEIGDRFYEAQSLGLLGEAHADLGEWTAARGFYASSRDLYDAIGMSPAAMEPMAGLARVALANADAAGAAHQVRAILDRVAAGTGWETQFPVRLTCWQVLAADGDTRAADILARACADLRRLADRVHDPSLRQSFLDGVPEHRQLLAAQAGRAA